VYRGLPNFSLRSIQSFLTFGSPAKEILNAYQEQSKGFAAYGEKQKVESVSSSSKE
jgi:hypothetical protein